MRCSSLKVCIYAGGDYVQCFPLSSVDLRAAKKLITSNYAHNNTPQRESFGEDAQYAISCLAQRAQQPSSWFHVIRENICYSVAGDAPSDIFTAILPLPGL